MKKPAISLIILLTVLSSCFNDPIAEPASVIRYELTGNFTGNNVNVTYTTASGGTVTEQVVSFPWTKEINYYPNVSSANITISGAGGTPGQQATLIVKRNLNPVGSPITTTADAGGAFSIVSPVITF